MNCELLKELLDCGAVIEIRSPYLNDPPGVSVEMSVDDEGDRWAVRHVVDPIDVGKDSLFYDLLTTLYRHYRTKVIKPAWFAKVRERLISWS